MRNFQIGLLNYLFIRSHGIILYRNLMSLWAPPTSRLHDVQYEQQNGPFKFRLETALLGANKLCHLANQHGALSHAERTGSVYKHGCWTISDSILDALPATPIKESQTQ
jgi:hypothetical protein